MMKPRFVAIFLAAAMAAGCGGKSAPQPAVVGHVADLSGDDARAGIQASQGIRLALDEVNKDAQRKIVVRHTDTHGKLESFEAEAIRLVEFNLVKAILGGNTPLEVKRLDRCRIVPAEGEQAKFLPIISPCGWRTPGMSSQVVLTGMTPAAQGKALARFAAENLKLAKVTVLVHQGTGTAQPLADAFDREFLEAASKKEPKAEPAAMVSIAFASDAKLTDVLPRLDEQKSPALLVAGPKSSLLLLAEKLKHRPVFLYGGDDGSLRPGDWPGAGPVYLASAFGVEKGNSEFVERYRKAFQQEPDIDAALAYENMKLLAEALRKAPDSPSQLRDELFKIKDFPGLLGPLSFDADRRLERKLTVLRLDPQR